MAKSVQISQELFIDIVRLVLLEDTSETRLNAVKRGLEDKIDKLARHDAYTRSKTELDPLKAEQARKQYLDMIGMRDSFRY